MDKLKKLSWISLAALLPLYFLAISCGIIRFGMDDNKYQKFNSIYISNPSLIQWLFWSTVILFPSVLFSYWIKLEIRQYIKGYIMAMVMLCVVSFFYIDSNIFLPFASLYSVLYSGIYFEKK